MNALLKYIALSFFASIIIFSSCTKRRELRELGCVQGKRSIGDNPATTIGPMTKKEFFEYLDSPRAQVKCNQGVVNFDMRWTKISKPEECTSELQGC